jgi:hypothetical protein
LLAHDLERGLRVKVQVKGDLLGYLPLEDVATDDLALDFLGVDRGPRPERLDSVAMQDAVDRVLADPCHPSDLRRGEPAGAVQAEHLALDLRCRL